MYKPNARQMPMHGGSGMMQMPGYDEQIQVPVADETVSPDVIDETVTPDVIDESIDVPMSAGGPTTDANPGDNVIQKGDTLWDLARKFTGSGANWKEFVAANPDINPKALQIGQRLRIPPAWKSGSATISQSPIAAPPNSAGQALSSLRSIVGSLGQ